MRRPLLFTIVVGALAASALLGASPRSLLDAAREGDQETCQGPGEKRCGRQRGPSRRHHRAALGSDGGQRRLAQLLLYAGANTQATTRLGGYTPLLLASKAGRVGVIDALLAGGADPNAATTTGTTPLMLAAASGKADGVQRFCSIGARASTRRSSCATDPALDFAAAFERADIIRTLAASGADLRATTKVIDLAAFSRDDRGGGRRGSAARRSLVSIANICSTSWSVFKAASHRC